MAPHGDAEEDLHALLSVSVVPSEAVTRTVSRILAAMLRTQSGAYAGSEILTRRWRLPLV